MEKTCELAFLQVHQQDAYPTNAGGGQLKLCAKPSPPFQGQHFRR